MAPLTDQQIAVFQLLALPDDPPIPRRSLVTCAGDPTQAWAFIRACQCASVDPWTGGTNKGGGACTPPVGGSASAGRSGATGSTWSERKARMTGTSCEIHAKTLAAGSEAESENPLDRASIKTTNRQKETTNAGTTSHDVSL